MKKTVILVLLVFLTFSMAKQSAKTRMILYPHNIRSEILFLLMVPL